MRLVDPLLALGVLFSVACGGQSPAPVTAAKPEVKNEKAEKSDGVARPITGAHEAHRGSQRRAARGVREGQGQVQVCAVGSWSRRPTADAIVRASASKQAGLATCATKPARRDCSTSSGLV